MHNFLTLSNMPIVAMTIPIVIFSSKFSHVHDNLGVTMQCDRKYDYAKISRLSKWWKLNPKWFRNHTLKL